VPALGEEGIDAGEWAHVMQEEIRDFYQLEKLWETDEASAGEAGQPG